MGSFPVVKAYRDDTAQQNATIVFVSLALKLLEERVHVACKELIILEKQVIVVLLDNIYKCFTTCPVPVSEN
jgi:hypothetical protein